MAVYTLLVSGMLASQERAMSPDKCSTSKITRMGLWREAIPHTSSSA